MTGNPNHDIMIGVILGFFIGLIFLKYVSPVYVAFAENVLRELEDKASGHTIRLEILEAPINGFERRSAARLEKRWGAEPMTVDQALCGDAFGGGIVNDADMVDSPLAGVSPTSPDTADDQNAVQQALAQLAHGAHGAKDLSEQLARLVNDFRKLGSN